MNKQEIKKLENKINAVFSKHTDKSSKFLLALSGGADSVFLLHILKKLNIIFTSAHLNHKLRERESDQDENFCKKLCQKEKIKFVSRKADVKAFSKKEKKGIEESARIIRYNFLKKILKKEKLNFILTAHHAEDNAETIIKNLSRGASLKGLSGIKIINNKIFRPLLDISKTEIVDYLTTHKISFREDSSNFDKKFHRNLIRHDIMPLFLKLNPSFTKTLSKNTEIIRENLDFIEQTAEDFIKKQEPFQINAKDFKKLHIAIQKEVLKKFCKTENLKNIHIEELILLIQNNIGNKSKTINGTKFKINSNIIQLEKKGI